MLYNVVFSFWLTTRWISCMCIYPLSPESPSHPTPLGHHRAASWAPCAVQKLPTSYTFTHSSVYMSVLLSQFIPPSPSIPYMCASTYPFKFFFFCAHVYTTYWHICIRWVYPCVEDTYRSGLRVLIHQDLRVQSQRKVMPKNAQTTAQLHSSHMLVMFKILQARLQQYVNRELPDVQAGFRKGRGTRDQIANICWIIEKAREFQENIYFCFVDYAKVFDCVDHHKLENSSRDGNTRPPDLPPEKSVCKSGSNS